jgi:Coenzyme PQQ synthesis protein D (PqqD)
MRPVARRDQLLVEQLPNETLVYDQTNDKAHCLNATAAFVWSHCDGRTSVHEIGLLMKAELKTPASDELVWLALERLDRSELLAAPLRRAGDEIAMSRRDVAKRLGLVGGLAVILPLVSSVRAANAQTAASCSSIVGAPCAGQSDCCWPLHCKGSQPKSCAP